MPDRRVHDLLTRSEDQVQAAPGFLDDLYVRLERERRHQSRARRTWLLRPDGHVAALASLIVMVGVALIVIAGRVAPSGGGEATQLAARPLPGYVGPNVAPDWLVPQNGRQLDVTYMGSGWTITYDVNKVGDGSATPAEQAAMLQAFYIRAFSAQGVTSTSESARVIRSTGSQPNVSIEIVGPGTDFQFRVVLTFG